MGGKNSASRMPAVATLAEAVELMSEHAPVVLILVDSTERVVDIHGALLHRVGHPSHQKINHRIEEIAPIPGVLAPIRQALAGVAATGDAWIEDRRWLVSARPVSVADEEMAVVLMTIVDDTDIRRALTAREQELERFAALVELSSDFIAMAELDGTVTYVNRAGRELVGLGPDDQAVGRPTSDYFTESGLSHSVEIEAAVRDHGGWEGVSELRNFTTGAAIPVRASSFLVTGPDGEGVALATVQRDLREQLATQEALAMRAQEQHDLAELGRMALTHSLQHLLDESVRRIETRFPGTLALVVKKVRTPSVARVVAASDPKWTTFEVSLDAASVVSLALREDRLVVSDDLNNDARFAEAPLAARMGIVAAIACPVPAVELGWGIVGVASREPQAWTPNDVAFMDALASTLGAALRRYELEAELQHQALHDALTGLPNRALVRDRLDHALSRSRRRGDRVAVLLLDLDDFKSVNDSLGHGTGDDVLEGLAQRLRAVVRPGDTVGRLGGDEFVVVAEGLVTDEEIARVAEDVLAACSETAVVDGRRLSMSASIGVALANAGRGTPATLLSEADMAMYRAKRDRPGTYRIFDEAMRGDLMGRVDIAGELREAIRGDRLKVEFQPIVDLAEGSVVAFEALARWTNLAGDAVPPDLFIRVAEETGTIGELGAWVLGAAAAQAAAWQDVAPGVGVRVNVSAHELRDRDYIRRLYGVLARSGLEPGLLGLEITESTFVDDSETTKENLSRIDALGISLLVDDFGTGYSSLSYLQRFPVIDVLKVDRSFVSDSAQGQAVVRAVLGLGSAFGVKVCAEGVENHEQRRFLVEVGCDLGQGYLFSPPIPGAEVAALLRNWTPQTAARKPA